MLTIKLVVLALVAFPLIFGVVAEDPTYESNCLDKSSSISPEFKLDDCIDAVTKFGLTGTPDKIMLWDPSAPGNIKTSGFCKVTLSKEPPHASNVMLDMP